MDYYCKMCDKTVKIKNKYKHFNSKTYKEIDKCKYIKSTTVNPLKKT